MKYLAVYTCNDRKIKNSNQKLKFLSTINVSLIKKIITPILDNKMKKENQYTYNSV